MRLVPQPPLALVLLATLAGQAPGQAPPTTAGTARAEVERLLREGGEAAHRGDLKGAAGLSAKACRLADQHLPEADALRVRATGEYLRVQTQAHLARGENRAALKDAGTLRRFAAGRGDAKSELSWAEYAHGIAERSLPAADPDRVSALVELALLKGNAAVRQGAPDEARTWAARASAAVESALPAGHADRLRAWSLLASVEMNQGRRGPADALGRRILAESRAGDTEPVKVVVRLEALLMCAGIGLVEGRPVGAELADGLAAQRKVFPTPKAFNDLVQRIAAVAVWSPLVTRAREEAAGAPGYDKAAGRLRDDIDRFEGALRRAGVEDAVCRLGSLPLAQFQWEQRRLSELDVTLGRFATAAGDPFLLPASVGEYWNFRGLLEVERANYDLARSHFATALGVWAGAGLPQQAVAMAGLGQLLLRQGDYPAAVERLRDAVARHELSGVLRGKVSHALALRNLSDALAGLGESDEAARLRGEGVAMAESGKPPDPYAVYLCRNSLGAAAYREGQFAEARVEFDKCLGAARASFGAGHFHAAEAEVNLGWIDLAQGRTAEAVGRFESALAVVKAGLGTDHPRYSEVLAYVARARATRGEAAEARRLLTDALDLRQRYLDRLLRSALSERDRLALVQDLRVHHESSAWPGVFDSFLELAPGLSIPVDDQYRRVLVWKGVLTRRPPSSGAGGADEGGPLGDLRRRRREALTRLRDALFLDKTGERAAALEAEVEDLERSIRAATPNPTPDRAAPLALAPVAVAAALPPGSALLDVIAVRRYRPRREGEAQQDDPSVYLAFLSRPGRPLVRVEMGDAAALDGQAERFVRGITRRDDVSEPGGRLSATIRAPLVPHLSGVETLVVAADGWLHRVPLCALPGAKPGGYWVEELAFAFVPSAQSFLDRRRAGGRPATRGALVVGGVDYGPPAAAPGGGRRGAGSGRLNTRWPALTQTRGEAEQVAAALRAAHIAGEVEVLSGSEATRARVRDGLTRCRFAHLATHGAFPEDREPGSAFATFGASAGFDSFLVLSQANLGRLDALLTAEDIEAMDLRGLELVVLSACQSGLGHVRAGQGVIGLPGALDRAGVAAVVSTLWSVEDEATRGFMDRYYRHLRDEGRSRGPGLALRDAQRDMIPGRVASSGGAPMNRPYQWAAFVLDGDPFPPPEADAAPAARP